MLAEDVLYRFDPRKVRLVSGDLPQGYWELHGCRLIRCRDMFDGSNTDSMEVNLDGCVKRLQLQKVADANPGANVLGVGVGALLGLRCCGRVGAITGAIAGQLLVGNRYDMTVKVHLTDGRHFVAHMDSAVYKRMQAVGARCAEFSDS